jgi:glycosyltransferase involved in cell wall biosynthesis
MSLTDSERVPQALPGREAVPVIAVIIPAYRAAAHIEKVLAGIPELVTHIIVVDDCSPDGTAELVAAWPDPRVHLVRHTVNQGVGAAMFTGYDTALALGAEVLVKMDSDGQMDPAHLLPLIAPILRGEADYTKGNRFLHSRELQQMPITRRIGNIGLSFLTKLASGYWNIFDPTNGYTAIHASILPMIDRSRIGHRYLFETTMLLELSALRAVVRDVYIPAKYGAETSSLSERRALIEFPPHLIKNFLRRLWIQYFVRDMTILSVYLVIGLILTIFGFVWGTWKWIEFARIDIAAPTGTVMLAVLPIVLGIQLLIQAVALDIQNVPTRPLHIPIAWLERWRRACNAGD